MSEYQKSDHERVASSGAWLGFGVGVGVLGWLDWHMPHVCGFLLDWTVVLAVCYGMARWKRAWYAWAAFWGMAAVCFMGGVLQLAGLMTSQWSTGSWVVGCAMLVAWYWIVRIPRLHPAKAPEVAHVVHHHVLHGQGAGLPAGFDVTAIPDAVARGWDAEQLPERKPRSIPATVRRAIDAPKVTPGQFGATVREAVRRRP